MFRDSLMGPQGQLSSAVNLYCMRQSSMPSTLGHLIIQSDCEVKFMVSRFQSVSSVNVTFDIPDLVVE